MTYLTVSEYAKREGISRQTAHWRIKKGKVKAIRQGFVWLVEEQTKKQD